MEGGEQAFVVVMKHLIDFDGNKRLFRWVCFNAYKLNIQCRTIGCASITFEMFTLNEQDHGKVK